MLIILTESSIFKNYLMFKKNKFKLKIDCFTKTGNQGEIPIFRSKYV